MTDNEIIKALEKEHKRLWAEAIKAEAIKEFAERLKSLLTPYPNCWFKEPVTSTQIDDLVKEMTDRKIKHKHATQKASEEA